MKKNGIEDIYELSPESSRSERQHKAWGASPRIE
jgi:hypothetical protein